VRVRVDVDVDEVVEVSGMVCQTVRAFSKTTDASLVIRPGQGPQFGYLTDSTELDRVELQGTHERSFFGGFGRRRQ
jgi:PHP family Zn ribbon phosphoesterase